MPTINGTFYTDQQLIDFCAEAIGECPTIADHTRWHQMLRDIVCDLRNSAQNNIVDWQLTDDNNDGTYDIEVTFANGTQNTFVLQNQDTRLGNPQPTDTNNNAIIDQIIWDILDSDGNPTGDTVVQPVQEQSLGSTGASAAPPDINGFVLNVNDDAVTSTYVAYINFRSAVFNPISGPTSLQLNARYLELTNADVDAAIGTTRGFYDIHLFYNQVSDTLSGVFVNEGTAPSAIPIGTTHRLKWGKYFKADDGGDFLDVSCKQVNNRFYYPNTSFVFSSSANPGEAVFLPLDGSNNNDTGTVLTAAAPVGGFINAGGPINVGAALPLEAMQAQATFVQENPNLDGDRIFEFMFDNRQFAVGYRPDRTVALSDFHENLVEFPVSRDNVGAIKTIELFKRFTGPPSGVAQTQSMTARMEWVDLYT